MAIRIVRPRQIRNGVRLYAYVHSASDRRRKHLVTYIRTASMRRWNCDCADFLFRRVGQRRVCKHIHRVREAIQ